MDNVKDIIYKRCGHVMVKYNDDIIVWGGFMQKDGLALNARSYHEVDKLYTFNTVSNKCISRLTSGEIPCKVSGACGVVLDDYLYVFGGYFPIEEDGEEFDTGYRNTLYRVNLITLVWEHLEPSGVLPTPCDKLAGWAYDGKIYFFAGFGQQPVNNNDSLWGWLDVGWNNQLFSYDVILNSWQRPLTCGPKPSPRAAHSAAISGSNVYVFGGRTHLGRNSELHVLNMNTLTWSGNLHEANQAGIPEPIDWPKGRSWHSFNFVSSNNAMIYGGLSDDDIVLDDCWGLSISRKNKVIWKRYRILDNIPLMWHIGCYLPQSNELYLHGGGRNYANFDKMCQAHNEKFVIIPLVPRSLVRLCADCIINKQVTYDYEYVLPATLMHMLDERREIEWPAEISVPVGPDNQPTVCEY